MSVIVEWLKSNYQWFFSGLGVVIISGVIGLLVTKNGGRVTQKQRSGSGSTNYQAGGNMTIGSPDHEQGE